jgi:hypothetical protein
MAARSLARYGLWVAIGHALSIGLGAAFPPLNQIAQPFVCSNGQMRVDSQTYRPMPGTTVTTLDWQCVDKKTGEAQPVNEMSMFLFNGLIYGFVLFGVIVLGYRIAMKRRARRVQQRAAVDVATSHTSSVELSQIPRLQFDNSENAELQELMRMQEKGQLSVAEYWRKLGKIHDRTANQSTAENSAGADATPPGDMPQVPPAVQFGNLGDYVQQELTRQREAGLISEQEYERKKAKLASKFHFSESAPIAHPAATTSLDTSAADELRKVKSLLDEGLITQQDYDQKKAEILSRM